MYITRPHHSNQLVFPESYHHHLYTMGSVQKWEEIVTRKQALRDQALKPYMVSDLDERPPQIHNVHERSCVRDDPIIQEITDIDNVLALLGQLKSGKYSAEQVVQAYIRRCVWR